MDDLAHELPRNTLKRKADQDDLQCPEPPKRTDSPHIPTSDPICVDTSVAHPRTHHRHHTNAPRQPYIAPISTTPMCLSPASPSQPNPLAGSEPFPKRPRTERHPPSSPPTKSRRKILGKSRQHTVRQGNDIEDIGIISNADPGPSTGSLLHLRESLPCTYYDDLSTILTSPSIPPLVPLISRQTLKELDFDIILRNPQLRMLHDFAAILTAHLHFLFSYVQQAMTCFSTPVYSSGQPSVGGNETWQIDIGELSFRSFKRDVHASHLISMADLAPPLVRVSKFHSRMETQLSFYHLP